MVTMSLSSCFEHRQDQVQFHLVWNAVSKIMCHILTYKEFMESILLLLPFFFQDRVQKAQKATDTSSILSTAVVWFS